MATSLHHSSTRRKLAFICGNDNYHRAENRLQDSIKNVNSLSDVLKKIHFNVTIACNLTSNQMNESVVDFAGKINDGDLVLFYFCGNGCSVNKKNYIIPVDDDRIETNRHIENFCIDIEWILTCFVKMNRSYVTVMILDCCRPFVMTNTSNKTSVIEWNGLHEMHVPSGAFLQFAGAPNHTANNNLFTKHLLKSIAQENIHIADVFEEITSKVFQESNRQQKPFFINGLYQHKEVYLNKKRLSTAKYLSKEPLSSDEKNYYEECKEYYRLTSKPLIAVSERIFDNKTELKGTSIKIGIDEDCTTFNLQDFLSKFCDKTNLKMKDIVVKKIQSGSSLVEIDVFDNVEPHEKKVKIQMTYHQITDEVKAYFAKLKVFFMFMGPIENLTEMQKFRAEVKLNPQHNRIYARGHDYWEGPNDDKKNRGNEPYYCPVGWQRWSFYITDRFDQKFRGWCICYHGTKFEHGLSILLSGLKPAKVDVHGAGIYATPSVNYAAHPRYAEVKAIDAASSEKFFKSGKYVQFVLECRVHPRNIKKIREETLGASYTIIDPNISNDVIEWLIDNQGKDLVDFNDPNATIICTGILIRVTDDHPGLLSQSRWWFESHVCDDPTCCLLGMDIKSLKRKKARGDTCQIIIQ